MKETLTTYLTLPLFPSKDEGQVMGSWQAKLKVWIPGAMENVSAEKENDKNLYDSPTRYSQLGEPMR